MRSHVACFLAPHVPLWRLCVLTLFFMCLFCVFAQIFEMARVQLAVFAGVFVLATLGAPTRGTRNAGNARNASAASHLVAALRGLTCIFFPASENGGYYTCLPLTDDYCVFKKSENAPSSWGDLGPHPVDPSMAEDLHRMLVNGQGNQLPPSPKPWTEGDAEVRFRWILLRGA